jgi:hypothetical protein
MIFLSLMVQYFSPVKVNPALRRAWLGLQVNQMAIIPLQNALFRW